MENFVVSARKYRPITFETVVGQSAITTTLKNAIKNNILAQAFLFCGPRGVGKTTCARIMAKSINCMNPGLDAEACDKCESCTSFNHSASFNIHELDAASNNSVDDIRSLVDQVRIPPQVGKYKIYIIDEVHMLSPAAFNAFLKTLEEPPAYAKFILATTEKHKIIPTILSRCQIFDFKRITVEDITRHLQFVASKEGVTAEEEALNIIAQKSDGALRDALSLFDQMVSFAGYNFTYKNVIENLNVLDYEYYFRITETLLQSNVSNTLLILNEIIDNGFDGQHFIIGLGNHLRNLLVSRDVNTLKIMEVSENLRNRYAMQAQQCQPEFLLKALDINNQCDLNYRNSNNKRLHLEISLLQIASLQNTGQAASSQQVPKIQMSAATTPHISPKQVSEPVHSAPTSPTTPKSAYPSNISTPKVAEPKTPVNEEFSRQKSTRTISISDFGKSNSEKQQLVEPELSDPFDLEQLKTVWNAFIVQNRTISPSFTNAISRYEPVLNEANEITFQTDNTLIVSDKLNINALLEFLKSKLRNTSVKLIPIVVDNPKELGAYTDKEKFEKLAADRPVLRTVKDQLNLETDF
ncbi:MAG: DNA polymerase III subunit gamma/tau [Bacteroidales bacterium]|nr:DNA polymerase III subunit gamma/tau [Bacteroidales bacterium]